MLGGSLKGYGDGFELMFPGHLIHVGRASTDVNDLDGGAVGVAHPAVVGVVIGIVYPLQDFPDISDLDSRTVFGVVVQHVQEQVDVGIVYACIGVPGVGNELWGGVKA